jgi:acylphosphatase
MESEIQCHLYLVTGRVQGVFFRESTARQARSLGLTGHAVNLRDGRVEVLACGPASALAKLEHWLWQGPPMARVDDVDQQAAPGDAPGGFTTGRK